MGGLMLELAAVSLYVLRHSLDFDRRERSFNEIDLYNFYYAYS